MKTQILLIILTALTASAQDFVMFTTNSLPYGYGAYMVNVRDRDEFRYWQKTHPDKLPTLIPSLMDMRTGDSVVCTNYLEAVSSLNGRVLATISDSVTAYTNAAVAVSGKHSLKDLRKATKKGKESNAIDALIARIEMLEAMLKQKGIMTPGAAMGEDD